MSDDNSSTSRTPQGLAFVNFVLCIIVYANVNTAILYKEGCLQGKEFDYIKYVLYGVIAQLCAIVLLIFSLCCEKYSHYIQLLCGFIIVGGCINQFVWLGILWDSYPADYILFYEKFWTTIRAGCVEESNKWVYIMMDVIIKITGGVAIITLIILAFRLCYYGITMKFMAHHYPRDLTEICTVTNA